MRQETHNKCTPDALSENEKQGKTMTNIESAFLRNANKRTSCNPTLRAGLLRVRHSVPLSLQLIF